ncbi:MAG: aldehyde ferredoxin oxidoreductase family protein [Actinobacteria bacterium]|nr:aldehyde ferredoxin oxidoreductase family protein [Actinomycetota bacterium]
MEGNWGKVLEVDLSNATSNAIEIDEQTYHDFIGGSGLAAKLFFDMRGWEPEPLAPESPMLIMLGPLSGTTLPGTSRLEICGLSPLTGTWCESSIGGHFAPQLKGTGFDGIIIRGKAKEPVYMLVTEDGAALHDASDLWGKDTFRTEELIQEATGDKVQVLSIGPGGENLVKFAAVMNEKGSAAGRGGMGAVMGSKNLKAIVARGKKKPQYPDTDVYKETRKRLNTKIKLSVVAAGANALGTNMYLGAGGMAIGDIPVKNWRRADWKEAPTKLGASTVKKEIFTKAHTCYACPIACKRTVEIPGGPYAMEEGPGSEYEAAASMGTMLMMGDLKANNKATDLCNRYGLDTISVGATIAYAIEAFKNGVFSLEQTDGLELDWDSPEVLIELLHKIANREGFGDILARGTRDVSSEYGGSEYAIHVKGMECPMHDPRSLWGMALSYGTSPRGATHCDDCNLTTDSGGVSHKDLGVKRSWPMSAKGKAAQTIAAQKKGMIINAAVLCITVDTAVNGFAMIPELLKAVAGFDYSVSDLAEVADRIWYTKKAITTLCGYTKADDLLPKRILEPHLEGNTSNRIRLMYVLGMSMGLMMKITNQKFIDVLSGFATKYLFPYIGASLRIIVDHLPGLRNQQKRIAAKDPEEMKRITVPYQSMLDEYYKLRDLDEQGRPSIERLESLGLRDVAEVLYNRK